MNQKFVSGIGNIYANEILFYCHLNPLKSISKLNDKNIFQAIMEISKHYSLGQITDQLFSLGGEYRRNM